MALAPDGRIYLAGGHHAAHVMVLIDPSLDGVDLVGMRAGGQPIVPGMLRANADGVAVGLEGRLGHTVESYAVRGLGRGEMSSCL